MCKQGMDQLKRNTATKDEEILSLRQAASNPLSSQSTGGDFEALQTLRL